MLIKRPLSSYYEISALYNFIKIQKIFYKFWPSKVIEIDFTHKSYYIVIFVSLKADKRAAGSPPAAPVQIYLLNSISLPQSQFLFKMIPNLLNKGWRTSHFYGVAPFCGPNTLIAPFYPMTGFLTSQSSSKLRSFSWIDKNYFVYSISQICLS